MTHNHFNSTTPAGEESAPSRRFDTNVNSQHIGESGKQARKSVEELAAELDELAAVPTEVLADWVTARGRCLWETTFGEPPEWTGEQEPDRELAHRMCAGCPVRSECLEFEVRIAGDQTLGVWGGLNADDRLALHKMWRSRRREDIATLAEGQEAGQ